jgi:1-acyl-sn-glycerol-3-phosphate acyltransferase
LLKKDKLIAEFSLLEVLMPKGPLGTMPPGLRKAFLTRQRFVDGAGIAQFDGATTTVTESDVTTSNWLPGTIEQVVGYMGDNGQDFLERIVVAEHSSRILRVHPSRVQVEDSGLCFNAPLNALVIESQRGEGSCLARGKASSLDWRRIRNHWVDRSEGQHYLVHDLGAALIRQFVRHIVIEDPAGFQQRMGQPAIYLANHQLYVESFLFLSAIAALTGIPAEAIAKSEHENDWVGDIYRLAEAEMVGRNPLQILFLDRSNPADLLRILENYGQTVAARPRSLLVHVEGTRARKAGQRTEKVSSVLIDLAISSGLPIVPVRFCGGLPLEDKGRKYDVPAGLGKQDHYIGAAIEAKFLKSLPYRERSTYILDGINNLGPDGSMDVPVPGDAEFSDLVRSQPSAQTELQKVLLSAVQTLPELGNRMQSLLDKISIGRTSVENLSPAEAIAMKLLWANR